MNFWKNSGRKKKNNISIYYCIGNSNQKNENMNMRVRERMLAICLLAFSVPVTVHAQEAEQVLTLDLKSAITVALSDNPM